MTSATRTTPTPKSRPGRRQAPSSPSVERPRSRRDGSASSERGLLGRYEDPQGRSRDIVQRPGGFGTVLVIDRDAATLGDCRLVAHMGPEEPRGNAELMCAEYLRALAEDRGGCREVTAQDVEVLPYAEPDVAGEVEVGPGSSAVVMDRDGNGYRLELIPSAMSIPVLRWRRHDAEGSGRGPTVVSVREVVSALEDYEPVCGITERALARWRTDESVSTVILGGEIERVRLSPIVLNRLLRLAVISAGQHHGLSLSALAIRCGRMKRDRSGETSWVARRIGVLPEGGQSAPTPWIHSDVLALIARRGLGISPREVEVQ